MTLGSEHFRSHRPRCMGTVWWQLNDCWPVISWAVVDSGGVLKPSWYALRRASAPRLVTVQPRGGGLAAVLVNDTAQPWQTTVDISRCGLAGQTARTATAARAHAGELLAGPDPPTAIFALNNLITVGVLEALRESRRPCALIGFDGFDLAELLRVTVVAQDPELMGERAAQLALARLGTAPPEPVRIVLPGRLVPHGSGELPPGRGMFE